MRTNTTLILTGATSGMGMRLAGLLGASGGVQLIAGARDLSKADALRRAVPRANLTLLPLDLSEPASVERFGDRVASEGMLDGIICNAGLQIISGLSKTRSGVEMTFAANHLGHFALVNQLLPRLRPGAIIMATASGTHDPNDWVAKRFGFRGGIFPSAEAVARGELDNAVSAAQQGADRYATSKLCNILWIKEMARRVPETQAKFLAYDPGLMPGTGLARDRSAAERFGWTYLLPMLRFVLPGISSAQQSAETYAHLIQDEARRFPSGAYVDFNGREIVPSNDAMRADLAQQLFTVSEGLIRGENVTP